MEVRVGLNHIIPDVADIPDGVEEEYHYLTVVSTKMTTVDFTTYYLFATKHPQVFAKHDTTGSYQYLCSTGAGYREFNGTKKMGWSPNEEIYDTVGKIFADCTVGIYEYAIVWSNHEIMVANETSNNISSTTAPTASATSYFAKGLEPATYTIPDVPEPSDDHKYMSILFAVDGDPGFALIMSAYEGYIFPASLVGQTCFAAGIETLSYRFCTCAPGDVEWSNAEQIDDEPAFVPTGSITEGNLALLWANYDVFVAADVTATIDTATVVSSAEIYLFRCDKQEMWEIAGAQIQALPPKLMRLYPYAALIKSNDDMYGFIASSSKKYFAPGSLMESGLDTLMFAENGYVYYAITAGDGNWNFLGEATDETISMEVGVVSDTVTRELVWTNQDIYVATNVDDPQNPVIGTELYRASDDDWRIYGAWLYSLGKQARRFGMLSGAVHPDKMEEIFKATQPASESGWIDGIEYVRDDTTYKYSMSSDTDDVYFPRGVGFVSDRNYPVNEAIFSNAKSISENSFYGHDGIEKVSAPAVETVGSSAFAQCTSLTNVELPEVTDIGFGVFMGCISLETISLPKVTATKPFRIFDGCTNLKSVDLPLAEEFGDMTFRNCTSLEEIVLPSLIATGTGPFEGCVSLRKADFRVLSWIGKSTAASTSSPDTFSGCAALEALIIRTETMCAIHGTISTIFANTPIAAGTGYIYVPSALVDTYKADANWSTYAAQIRAIEDYPDICGTTA